jgi:hypothetical protein
VKEYNLLTLIHTILRKLVHLLLSKRQLLNIRVPTIQHPVARLKIALCADTNMIDVLLG